MKSHDDDDDEVHDDGLCVERRRRTFRPRCSGAAQNVLMYFLSSTLPPISLFVLLASQISHYFYYYCCARSWRTYYIDLFASINFIKYARFVSLPSLFVPLISANFAMILQSECVPVRKILRSKWRAPATKTTSTTTAERCCAT